MLQNASLLAIVAIDTEENEPFKNENGAVRRDVNLVDLEKCCKITIWLLS